MLHSILTSFGRPLDEGQLETSIMTPLELSLSLSLCSCALVCDSRCMSGKRWLREGVKECVCACYLRYGS